MALCVRCRCCTSVHMNSASKENVKLTASSHSEKLTCSISASARWIGITTGNCGGGFCSSGKVKAIQAWKFVCPSLFGF